MDKSGKEETVSRDKEKTNVTIQPFTKTLLVPQSNDNSAEVGKYSAAGHGKIILLGEHAVVYGSHALAAPIPTAVQAKVTPLSEKEGIQLIIPAWDMEQTIDPDHKKRSPFQKPAATILDTLGLQKEKMIIEVFPKMARGSGMGGSAAVAVAIVRALDKAYDLNLSLETINELAFESEKMAHAKPSGVDNTVATYGEPLLFRKGEPPFMRPLVLAKPLEIIVGMTGVESLTAPMVEKVRALRDKDSTRYDGVFQDIDKLVCEGFDTLKQGNLKKFGDLMNLNHGFLNMLQVSCWELEELVQLARDNGALGAKLTGGGGGGAMIALCDPIIKNHGDILIHEMEKAGYNGQKITLEQG